MGVSSQFSVPVTLPRVKSHIQNRIRSLRTMSRRDSVPLPGIETPSVHIISLMSLFQFIVATNHIQNFWTASVPCEVTSPIVACVVWLYHKRRTRGMRWREFICGSSTELPERIKSLYGTVQAYSRNRKQWRLYILNLCGVSPFGCSSAVKFLFVIITRCACIFVYTLKNIRLNDFKDSIELDAIRIIFVKRNALLVKFHNFLEKQALFHVCKWSIL